MKRGMHTAVSRRRLLQGAAAGLFGAAGAAVLAACGETQVVTKEVIKEVPVERVVTKEVIKEVPVETVVTKEVIKEVVVERVVTKEVIKEVMVTAAPAMEQEMTGPVSGGTITVGAGTPATRFWNPYAQWGSQHHAINDYVWLQLWYGDQWGDGRLPALPGGWGAGAAQSWDEIEPSRVYDFHLHPDLNWHDGAPVIADDVVWSYQMAIDPAYGAKFADITYINIQGSQAWAENPTDNVEDSGGVVKIDDKTVRVSLENPNPGWWGRPLKDRSVHLPPYPKHLYKDIDPATAFEGHPLAETPVGNGALKAVRYVEGQFYELEANDDFPYGAPYIDRYIIRYGDRDAHDAATEAGELDHIRAGTVESFVRLGDQPHLQAFPQRSPFGSVVWLQRGSEIFKDTNISLLAEAMVLALDRDTVNATLDRGTRFKTDYVWAHVGLIADPPAGTYRELPYDPEASRALIAESGFDTGQTIRWIRWSDPGPRDLAFQEYYADVGLDVQFLRIDVAAVVEELYESRNWDLSMHNFGGFNTLEDGWQRMRCGWYYSQAGFNAADVCDPVIDAMYEKAQQISDVAELQEAWFEIAKYIHARGTMVAGPVDYGTIRNIYHRRIQGPLFQQTYVQPVRSPVERTWIDPRWDGKEFNG